MRGRPNDGHEKKRREILEQIWQRMKLPLDEKDIMGGLDIANDVYETTSWLPEEKRKTLLWTMLGFELVYRSTHHLGYPGERLFFAHEALKYLLKKQWIELANYILTESGWTFNYCHTVYGLSLRKIEWHDVWKEENL